MSVKAQFIQNRQGKDFVLYGGLLDAAHEAGLAGIATRLLQTPGPDNEQTAICHATVTMRDAEGRERSFDGIGDANPANVNRMIAAHLIRMAETRAKARALRDAINVGMASIEELGGDDQDAPVDRPAPMRATTTPRAGSAGPGREAPAPRRSAAPTDRPAAVPSAAGPPAPDNGKRVPTFAEALSYALDEKISAKGRHRAATIALELAGSLDELADTYSKVMALPEREGLKETYETRHEALKELDAVPF